MKRIFPNADDYRIQRLVDACSDEHFSMNECDPRGEDDSPLTLESIRGEYDPPNDRQHPHPFCSSLGNELGRRGRHEVAEMVYENCKGDADLAPLDCELLTAREAHSESLARWEQTKSIATVAVTAVVAALIVGYVFRNRNRWRMGRLRANEPTPTRPLTDATPPPPQMAQPAVRPPARPAPFKFGNAATS